MARKKKYINDTALDSLCRGYTDKAIKTLGGIMIDEGQPGATRVTAAINLLDRGWGKPKQVTKVEGSATDPLIVEIINYAASKTSGK